MMNKIDAYAESTHNSACLSLFLADLMGFSKLLKIEDCLCCVPLTSFFYLISLWVKLPDGGPPICSRSLGACDLFFVFGLAAWSYCACVARLLVYADLSF